MSKIPNQQTLERVVTPTVTSAISPAVFGTTSSPRDIAAAKLLEKLRAETALEQKTAAEKEASMKHKAAVSAAAVSAAAEKKEAESELAEILEDASDGEPLYVGATTGRFTTKDSGNKETFGSGMKRNSAVGRTDYHRIYDGPMLDRWAELLTRGAMVYKDLPNGTANWMLASGPAELARFTASAARHFRQWVRGDVDEDHAAAVLFNLNGAEYVKDRMKLLETNPPSC